VGYFSSGFSDLEYSVDVGLGVTGYQFVRELARPRRTLSRLRNGLEVFRPSVGASLIWAMDTQVSLRGSYALYSSDPLTTGHYTDAQLEQLQGRLLQASQRTLLRDRSLRATLETFAQRLYQADALSGLPTAPVLFDLRVRVTHAFGRRLEGQLGYTYTAYVPTQGLGHLASTKWTVRPVDRVGFFAALSLQWDVIPSAPVSRTALASLGLDFRF
jgi:hypothetical protein